MKIGHLVLGVLAVGAVLFGEMSAHAGDCPDAQVYHSSIRATSMEFADGTCVVTISPALTEGLRYRQYLFTDAGLFMVFNSVDGPQSSSTGARSYFLFPRKNRVSFEALESGDVAVSSSVGSVFRFSGKTTHLAEISQIQFSEEDEINLKNRGGVEILHAPGLVLDTGWNVGEVSFSKPDRKSVFRDHRAHECSVKNREIFDQSADPRFKFATDSELAQFLKKRCPQLDTSSLH